jgi:Putative bacterial sensory transduction regulator
VFQVISLALLAPPAHAQDADGLYRSVAGPELAEVLGSLGLQPEVRPIGDGMPALVFQASGYKMVVFTYECTDTACAAVQLYAGFTGKKAPKLKVINAWNRDNRAGRAYIDDVEDPVLESDLSLVGGVTRDTLVHWVQDFQNAVPAFAYHIGF